VGKFRRVYRVTARAKWEIPNPQQIADDYQVLAWWNLKTVHLCWSVCVSGRFQRQEDRVMRMGEMEIYDYARQLLEAHGQMAVVEAAQKARSFEENGETEEAETWRGIEAALKLMRGPHVSWVTASSAMSAFDPKRTLARTHTTASRMFTPAMNADD
jgi:hypothetical protein